jgi:hypothetical protein
MPQLPSACKETIEARKQGTRTIGSRTRLQRQSWRWMTPVIVTRGIILEWDYDRYVLVCFCYADRLLATSHVHDLLHTTVRLYIRRRNKFLLASVCVCEYEKEQVKRCSENTPVRLFTAAVHRHSKQGAGLHVPHDTAQSARRGRQYFKR